MPFYFLLIYRKWLIFAIYAKSFWVFREKLHPLFKKYFDMRSGMATDGLYPTVTIRQIMWALKMKPIKRERWETVFDRRDI